MMRSDEGGRDRERQREEKMEGKEGRDQVRRYFEGVRNWCGMARAHKNGRLE